MIKKQSYMKHYQQYVTTTDSDCKDKTEND